MLETSYKYNNRKENKYKNGDNKAGSHNIIDDSTHLDLFEEESRMVKIIKCMAMFCYNQSYAF